MYPPLLSCIERSKRIGKEFADCNLWCYGTPLCRIPDCDGARWRHSITIHSHQGHSLATLSQQLWWPTWPRLFCLRLNCGRNISGLWHVTKGSHLWKMYFKAQCSSTVTFLKNCGALLFDCDVSVMLQWRDYTTHRESFNLSKTLILRIAKQLRQKIYSLISTLPE